MICLGKMVPITSCFRKAIAYSISLAYGYMVCLFTFYSILKYRREYFQVRKREKQPEILRNPSYGEHHFVRLGDVDIHYVAKGKEENQLVIFLHGFPDFWFSWRHILPAISKTYYAVAMDLRGYGESDKLAYLKSYEVDEINEDISRLMQHLGKNQAVLVGHDWGGFIASEFALKYPQKVSKLVIINASHFSVFTKVLRSDLKQFLQSWYIFFFQLYLLPELIMLGKDLSSLENAYVGVNGQELLNTEEMEAYKYAFSRPGAFTCAINYYRANFDINRSLNVTSKINSPTLVIWGQEDPYLTVKIATGLAKIADNIRFEFLNASHFVHMEKPNEVEKLITEFLGNDA